jgi:pSer/pThr/pTyr-binding forkhead associated (FHA) protein
MKFCLLVKQGSSQGRQIPISKAEFVIGRDEKCNLRPASLAVSKRHCALRIKGEGVFVEDLGSTNGTLVNGEAAKGEKELHNGDKVTVGPLEFVVQLETQAEKPTHVEKETRVPAKPQPQGKPAKAPVKQPEHKSSEPLDEDAIGSMLLSLGDDGQETGDPSDSFANGSTVCQVLKPEEMEQLQNTEKAPYRPTAKAAADGNTSSAAKAILEKYRRRPKQ